MDCIHIKNLRIFAHHGVFPEENEQGQTFVVNATLHTDTRRAGTTDDLTHSTHYGLVCETIGKVMKNTHQLIETVAEEVASTILQTYPLVRAVDVEILKPEAPIPMDFETVSVNIHRGWTRAFIALGSNMGDKEGYLRQALDSLAADPSIRLLHTSTFLTTSPYGGVEQDDFLNGAAEIETLYDPHQLLDQLHAIEQAADRVRTLRWGPRTLDLDILFYGDLVMDDESLIIPHIDLENRDFVLAPMAEIAPGFVHPISRKTMARLWLDWKENHPCG